MWYSRWPVVWFLLSALLVIWDAGFVLLRPHTLPKGSLHHLFAPYALYIEVDRPYGDVENEFVWGQAWLNLVEVCLEFLTIFLILTRRPKSILYGFLVSTLTFWKTMLYMIQYTELCNGSHMVRHLDMATYIFLFIIPNGFWLVFPFVLMVYYGRKLSSALDNTHQVKKE